ncbi:hypothetical protein MFIFM68171_07944 [Madurella fahalii]|uniref:Uncharacterized protein n=1 Tax=Madurella fahalii TaxID=1157608 RepID=A0ABQ0GIY3_9PEZI
MILFAQSGLYFSCSNGLVWEYGRIPEEPLSFSVYSILQDCSAAEIYRKWNLQITTQFSGRQATYLTDSLPALSGTAQIFAAALDDEYVAGLWKKDLLAGLFWKMEGSLRSCLVALLRSFDGPYIGPSWSWVGRAAGESAVDVNDPDQSWRHDLILVLLGSIFYNDLESGDDGSGGLPCGLIVHRAKANDEYWRIGTFRPFTVETSSETVSDLDMNFCCGWELRTLRIM